MPGVSEQEADRGLRVSGEARTIVDEANILEGRLV